MKWNHEEKTIIPVKKPPRRDKALYMPCFEFFTKSNHSTVPTPLTSKSDYATAKASYQCQDWFLLCEVKLVAQSSPSLCEPMAVAHQAPLSIEFSRRETQSG